MAVVKMITEGRGERPKAGRESDEAIHDEAVSLFLSIPQEQKLRFRCDDPFCCALWGFPTGISKTRCRPAQAVAPMMERPAPQGNCADPRAVFHLRYG